MIAAMKLAEPEAAAFSPPRELSTGAGGITGLNVGGELGGEVGGSVLGMGGGRVGLVVGDPVGCEVASGLGTAGASVGFRVVGGRVNTAGPPIGLGVGEAV